MGKQISHLPASKIEIGAPIVVLLRIPIAPLHRTEEVGPVEIGRLFAQRIGSLPKVVAVAVPPGSRQGNLPKSSAVEVFLLGLEVMDTRALLHSDLAHSLVNARGFDDQRTFFDGARQGLFDVHVFACVQRVDCRAGMPVIRRGD